jgi:putative transposase
MKVLQRPVESAQYTSVAFTAELIESGIAGSIGSVGDALDNALMESTIGLCKTEAINLAGKTWRDRRDVEWQVASWVHWYNADRLHSSIGDLPPLEFEQRHRRATTVTPNSEVA